MILYEWYDIYHFGPLLRVLGRVVVDDQGHALHIQAAGRNVLETSMGKIDGTMMNGAYLDMELDTEEPSI
jgi:hypothetical protein